MNRVNPQLLKMAQAKVGMQKSAVIPPEAPPMGPADPAAGGGGVPMGGPPMGDPAAMGGAPPPPMDPAMGGAMPPGAAPPMGAPPMDPAAAAAGAPPAAPAAPQKPKVDEVVAGMERRMQRMEKTLASMAGAQGVSISPEDMVEPALTDDQGNASPESVSNPQSSEAQTEFSDPAAAGADPAAGAAPPPGGDIGTVGGLDAMAGPKMAEALPYGHQQSHPSRIGSAIAKPSAGNMRDKAAALAGVMRRANATAR